MLCMRSFFLFSSAERRTGFLTQQQPRRASSVVQIKEIRKWSDCRCAAFSLCDRESFKMNSIHTHRTYIHSLRCPSLSEMCGACDFQQSAKNGLDCGCSASAQFFRLHLPFSKPEVGYTPSSLCQLIKPK